MASQAPHVQTSRNKREASDPWIVDPRGPFPAFFPWKGDWEFVDESEFDLPPIIGDVSELQGMLLGKRTSQEPRDRILGMEVGDDRVDLTHRRDTLEAMEKVQSSVFLMKTSAEDTYISNQHVNFCEMTVMIPTSKSNSFDWARKSGDFSKLGYTDYPKLRLIANVSKEGGDHSSSAVGKASLHASQTRASNTANRFRMELASWIQDGMLNTSCSPEPKYMDRALGGSGAPPLFGNWKNTYLHMRTYKNGTYARVYGTAINEARTCLEQMESGRESSAKLCAKLRQKQELLHGTYGNMVFLPHGQLSESVREIDATPLIRGEDVNSSVHSILNRLARARLVIGRAAAEIETNRTYRLRSVLMGYLPTKLAIKLEARAKRHKLEERGASLRANAHFQRLLDRKAAQGDADYLRSHGMDVIFTGEKDLRPDHIRWLCNPKKGIYGLDDLSSNEDIFVREEVSVDESLKVPGIPIRTSIHNKIKDQTTRSQVGLYEISETMYEWGKRHLANLVHLRDSRDRSLTAREILHEFENDLEWVNDDSGLLSLAQEKMLWTDRSASLLLVSEDTLLAQRIANDIHRNVHIVAPGGVMQAIPHKAPWKSTSTLTWEELRPHVKVDPRTFVPPTVTMTDSGATLAKSINLVEDNEGGSKKIKTKTILETGNNDGVRFERYLLSDEKPSVQVSTYTPKGKRAPRRTMNYGARSYSEASW